MKKLQGFFTSLIFLLASLAVYGQSKTGADYFDGKWNVLIKGTPGGDARMFVALEKKDSTVAGVVQDSTGKEISRITSVELKDAQVTVYFTAQGYDVSLVLNKKDEDHVTGSLLGMFDAEGDRVKAMK